MSHRNHLSCEEMFLFNFFSPLSPKKKIEDNSLFLQPYTICPEHFTFHNLYCIGKFLHGNKGTCHPKEWIIPVFFKGFVVVL